jgi:hypothetical protein
VVGGLEDVVRGADADKGDLVLCRTNAPLIRAAYKLIAAGKKASVKGRGIDKQILDLMGRASGTPTIMAMLSRAQELTGREVQRWLGLPNGRGGQRAQGAQDRMECLFAAAEGCQTTVEVERKLAALFDESVRGVRCSTVHSAKGLEAGRVYVLEPEKLPHPMARKDWEVEQEWNCLYVALTRSRRELWFVGGAPGAGRLNEVLGGGA